MFNFLSFFNISGKASADNSSQIESRPIGKTPVDDSFQMESRPRSNSLPTLPSPCMYSDSPQSDESAQIDPSLYPVLDSFPVIQSNDYFSCVNKKIWGRTYEVNKAFTFDDIQFDIGIRFVLKDDIISITVNGEDKYVRIA
jgi:hypothetical protein